jgi:hypothetical protein
MLFSSRARAAAMASGNGASRYNPAAPTGGVGPMRHSASAWIRSDTRPYDVRSDPRSYYGDRRDSGFGTGYDASRDNPYVAPGYANADGSGGGQAGMYSMREYRELPPHARADSMGYGANR